MRIFAIPQRSEEWDRMRNRPTCSEFCSIITPARGQYSAQATAYAARVVAKRMGVYIEPPQTFWQEWGIEHEEEAKRAYELETGRKVTEVGFVMPDHTDAYGGSPDGLVGDDGIIEVKCPAPETLISYHAQGKLPDQYRPQIQGLLMISERPWADFWAWHPSIPPFLLRVEADLDYQAKLAECLLQLLEEIAEIERKLQWTI